MKAKLYKLKEKYILCSGDDFHNKNLQPNDLAYHRGSKEILKVLIKNELTGSWECNDGTNRDSYKLFKVLTQSPDFSLLKEEDAKRIGWFDVEELALKSFSKNEKTSWGKSYSYDNEKRREGFAIGFQKHAELTEDRRFTEEDMEKAIAIAWYRGAENSFEGRTFITDDNVKEIIQSPSQPKSWEVECLEENGNFKIISIIQ